MSLPFALDDVRKVTFFKVDEITTDLICCNVEVDAAGGCQTWSQHEEDGSWQNWIDELSALPNFDSDWFSKVSTPTFASSVTVAYQRPVA